ncbi:MAG: c(7)-type cytochrome triheme domain-containing protein [Nitrospinota bacterium]
MGKMLNSFLISIMTISILGGGFVFYDKVFSYDLEWGDLVLDATYESMKKAGVDKVLFPHWFHRVRYKCKACHSHIFKMKKGSNKINMGGIIAGDWCGKCHNGEIAFSPMDCARCHSYKEKDLSSGVEKRYKQHVERKKKAEAIRAARMKESEDEDDDFEDEDDEEELPENIFARLNVKKAPIDPNNPIYMTRNGKLGSTGEYGNKVSLAAKLGALKKNEALKGLRLDRFGLINWVAAIKDGKLSLVSGINPVFNKDKFEDYVVLWKAKSDFLEDVAYPHDIHTYLIDCNSCHPSPFISKAGKNPDVLMAKFAEGKWCGKCHGKVAFPLDDCHRCHSREKLRLDENA